MKKVLIICISTLALLNSCVSYRQVTYAPNDLFESKRVQSNIDKYKVYVHSGGSVGYLENPYLNNNELTGQLTYAEPMDIVETPKKKEEIKLHKKEMHVYLSGGEEFSFPSEPAASRRITIAKNDVKSIKAVSTNEKEIVSIVAIVAGVFVLVILALVLIISLIVVAVVAGTEASSDGSGTSSSSSDGSGCYVATMAYGSYDAPQVLRLRHFRDSFLAQRVWGRKFIQWYYRTSPGFVEKTKSFKAFHSVVRVLLNAFVTLLRFLKLA